MKLLIASHNVHKIHELRDMLRRFDKLEVMSLLDFPNYEAPPEDLESLSLIATAKAMHAASALSILALGDDSGLFIPALGDKAPGVRSRRYASLHATDSENRKKLLAEMRHLEGPDRAAYFECSLALALPGELKKCVIGTSYGEIASEERGSNGFGYESLFIKEGYGQTFAEMDRIVKNRISHRHNALQKLLPTLEMLIG
jgi:XTP/dITP diphosphohydrolase